MRKLAAVMLFTLGLNACAVPHKGGGVFYSNASERKLAAAVELQKEGKTEAAMEALIALCAGEGVPGVTDEALFRLTLLSLRNGQENEKEPLHLAQQSIERLRKEYPTSPWTGMAAPVTELLSTTSELRHQNRTLKNQNQALTKENQALAKENHELQQNIEKLKRLDLELEQKRK